MTAKEYLQQVEIKNSEIDNLINDKKQLRDLMYSFGGNQEGERVQSSRNNDKLGSLYAKLDEKEREIAAKIDDLIGFKLKVSREIDGLSKATYITLLNKRYIRLLPWEQIATEMDYSIGHVFNLHGEALLEFGKKYLSKSE